MKTLVEIIDGLINLLPTHNLPKGDGFRKMLDRCYQAGLIDKKDLLVDHYYGGKCRNAHIARWDGREFTYMRTKFGDCFPETIQHPETDDGFDLFLPVLDLGPLDHKIIERTVLRQEAPRVSRSAKQCAGEQNEKSKQNHVV